MSANMLDMSPSGRARPISSRPPSSLGQRIFHDMSPSSNNRCDSTNHTRSSVSSHVVRRHTPCSRAWRSMAICCLGCCRKSNVEPPQEARSITDVFDGRLSRSKPTSHAWCSTLICTMLRTTLTTPGKQRANGSNTRPANTNSHHSPWPTKCPAGACRLHTA